MSKTLSTRTRRPGARRAVPRRAVLIATLLALLVTAAVALADTGALTQKPGTAGCVSETGSGGACTDGRALLGATLVAVSPDGRSAYVASFAANAVAILDRDPGTGALTPKPGSAGCVSEDGSGGACADGKALDNPTSVAVSADGRSVYAASVDSDAVAVFDRDPGTGALTQKPGTAGCISEDGSGGACADGSGLDGAQSVAVSADGTSVYAASFSGDAVAILDRDPGTGALTQKPGTAGCISETGSGGACADGTGLATPRSVAVSPDGRSVYTTSTTSNAVAILDRDPDTGALAQKPGTAGCISEDGTGGACADGRALLTPWSVTVSADGTSAYVAAIDSDAVAVFDRDPDTGALAQKSSTAGCVSEDGTGGLCADGKALDGARSVAGSPDGLSAYAASGAGNAVAVFDRDSDSGDLTQKPGTAGCTSETGTGGACTDGRALDSAGSVAISADGRSAYVTAFNSAAVAVFDREPPPPADTAVDGSAKAKKRQKQEGGKVVVKVKVKAGEDLDARVSGKVKVNPSYKLKAVSKQIAAGETATLKLKPKKRKHATKIAAALKAGEKAKAKLEVTLADTASNLDSSRLSVRLKH